MKQRIITAILALIIFIPIVIYGNWPFILLAYLLAIIGLFELLNMRFSKGYFVLPIILVIISLIYLLLPNEYLITNLPKANILIALILLLLMYTVFSKNKFTFDDVGFMIISLIYISIGFYFLIYARELGLNYLLFILFVIWSTDTGAYFSGYAFGKGKLWP